MKNLHKKIMLTLIAMPLLAAEHEKPQRPATLEEIKVIMSAERQKAATQQPTSYLGYLPKEIGQMVIPYVATHIASWEELGKDQDAFFRGLSDYIRPTIRAALGNKELREATPEQKLELLQLIFSLSRVQLRLSASKQSPAIVADPEWPDKSAILAVAHALNYKNFADIANTHKIGDLIEYLKNNSKLGYHRIAQLLSRMPAPYYTPAIRQWLEREERHIHYRERNY